MRCGELEFDGCEGFSFYGVGGVCKGIVRERVGWVWTERMELSRVQRRGKWSELTKLESTCALG